MKLGTILATVALLTGAADAQAKIGLKEVQKTYSDGMAQLEKWTKGEEIGYILNPIICRKVDGKKFVLIFSDDFRHKEQAYLIDDENGPGAYKTSKLKLERVRSAPCGDVLAEIVRFKNDDLLCVSSMMQLESVGGPAERCEL